MSERDDETYIGDGVYARHDGYHVWLRAERDGMQHEVALEPDVVGNLTQFIRDTYAKHGADMPAHFNIVAGDRS